MSLDAVQTVEKARAYLASAGRKPVAPRIFEDTTNFMNIDYGDILLLESGSYLILGHEREGRFGLDDEIKPWVKKAVDLMTGGRKVVKLEFHEKFQLNIGSLTYQCFRSPKKESNILKLVRGAPNFMQGLSTQDSKGNIVRVLDFITGPSFDRVVSELAESHLDYYQNSLPGLLDLFRPCLSGLHFLHSNMEKHGDVRRDHLIHSAAGQLAWIDFDYNYMHGEYIGGLDLVGVGNILAFLIGGGDHTPLTIKVTRPEIGGELRQEDMSLVFQNRIFNLKKVFPYISDKLNRILMHFAVGATSFYNTIEELIQDYDAARRDLP